MEAAQQKFLKIFMKIILPWTHNLLRRYGIDGYKKISLDKILQISEENGGKLNFTFARQIAPFNIETILALLYIKGIIDKYSDKVGEVNLHILQWGDDKFSLGNIEKRIFVELQTLDDKEYYIAVQSKKQLKKNIKIRDVYLDVDKIREMIKGTGLEYMRKSLDYLIKKEKVTKIKEREESKDAVNILDFWGLTTLYYIGEVSRDIFGINNYEINEFKDEIELANKDQYKISGYELTFEYKGKKLRFRTYDASHIYEKENEEYKKEEKMNSYITLALYSGIGYILLEEDSGKSSVDQKIREFYKEAKDKTGYDILILEADEKKLIERGIISEDSYVEFIGKDKIEKIINTIKETYGI